MIEPTTVRWLDNPCRVEALLDFAYGGYHGDCPRCDHDPAPNELLVNFDGADSNRWYCVGCAGEMMRQSIPAPQ